MALFSSPSNSRVDSRLLGYQASTSLVGRPKPIVYGRNRLAPNVIATAGWQANPVNAGKGNKGKTNSQQYDYIAWILMGLAQGPINGVFGIWQDRDRFNLAYSTEQVPLGAGTYTGTYGGIGKPYWWVANIGVSRQDTHTFTVDDYGSSGPVTQTVTVETPMVLVQSSPAAGQYTLDTATGFAVYGFSSADSGKQISVSYSYSINNFSTSGDPLVHLNLILFAGEKGQQPWSEWQHLFPTLTLGYSELAYLASGQFDLGSSGMIPSLNFEVQGRCGLGSASVPDANPADILNDMLTNPLDGVLGWATPGSGSALVAVAVNGECTVTHGVLDTGLGATWGTYLQATSGDFSQFSVGQQINIIGGLGVDNVTTTIASITDSTHIRTVDAIDFQIYSTFQFTGTVMESESVVAGSSLWLPSGSSSVGLGASGELYTYCAANRIFISPIMGADGQQEARAIINGILETANADCFWSEGVLKFRSYGDTSAAGGAPGVGPVMFTPNTQPIYDITDDDLICDPGQEPVRVKRKDVRDIKNQVKIEFLNRAADYATNVLPPAEDSWSIALYGRRPADSQAKRDICQQSVAELVANNMLRRAVYIDGANQYEITVGPHFGRLEPMDLITLTDGPGGTPSQFYLFDKRPLRIIEIEEDDQARLKLTLEEFPWSVSAPTLYAKQPAAPTKAFGFFADPGPVNDPPMFVQLPPEVTQGNLYTVGIALSGSSNWGGAQVYVSTDGISYTLVGKQTGEATVGLLTSALPAAADPDTTNTPGVSLTISYGQLGSNSKAQADAAVLGSLVAIDDELLAYETATPLGGFGYTLSYLRRGAYDSSISAHAVDAPFCLIDAGMFEYEYDASQIGTTIYFKFCSFNQAGGRLQDISQVQAYPYFVTGPRTSYAWSPGYAAPLAGDAVYLAGASGPASFGVQPGYNLDGRGTGTLELAIKGIPPINTLSQTVAPPTITCTASSTGGSLAGGVYVVGVTAFDGTGTTYRNTAFSNLVTVTVPSGSTGSITVNVTWASGSVGGDIYVASPTADNGFHYNQHLGTGTPSATITLMGFDTPGGPDPLFDHFHIRWTKVIHAGVWAQQAQNISYNSGTGYSTIVFADPPGGTGMTLNQWQGYILSSLAKIDTTQDVPLVNMPVISSTASSGGLFSITIGPNANGVQMESLLFLFEIGDLFVMRTKATFTATSFSDANIANEYYPTGDTGVEAGNLALVLDGPDAGDIQTIAGVSGTNNTQYNLAGSWKIKPNDGDRVIILDSAWTDFLTTPFQIKNKVSLNGTIATPPIPNLAKQVYFVMVHTEDAQGNHGPDSLAPWREVLFEGTQGTRVVTESTTQLITDRVVLFDTSSVPLSDPNYPNLAYECLPMSEAPNVNLYLEKLSADSNIAKVISYPGDVGTGAPAEAFSDGLTEIDLIVQGQNENLQFHGQ